MVHFDTDALKVEASELETLMSEADFWNDQQNAQKILRRSKNIKKTLDIFNKLGIDYDEVQILIEMSLEERDSSSKDELLEMENDVKLRICSLKKAIDAFKLRTLLTGEYDSNNVILSINAGAGGLDAQDWAEMLYRMYSRWANQNDYTMQTLDIVTDTEAGIKSVTVLIEGDYAYGYLKAEKGVHRLVRISPFDSSGKRHTSFASVDIMPEIDENTEVDINPSDLKIDTYRSSGAGGQHVNTTDSAVRITHMPTGVVVQCQNERSQIMNRATAMKMLLGKLTELKIREQKEKIEDLQGDYSQIAWGSQIRSYVFQPYTMVKDHRTLYEKGDVYAVMDGDVQGFMDAYLTFDGKI